eukprot:1507084-Pyramimonas_sp.AAC.1
MWRTRLSPPSTSESSAPTACGAWVASVLSWIKWPGALATPTVRAAAQMGGLSQSPRTIGGAPSYSACRGKSWPSTNRPGGPALPWMT